MDRTSDTFTPDHTQHTSDIVAAYVSHNSLQTGQLPELISSVFSALSALGKSSVDVDKVEKISPADIRKSIKVDGLVSFIDGKTYKTLKRHLAGLDLTPATYRAKYGLPHNYPLIRQLILRNGRSWLRAFD